jgi:hypothetical protein
VELNIIHWELPKSGSGALQMSAVFLLLVGKKFSDTPFPKRRFEIHLDSETSD